MNKNVLKKKQNKTKEIYRVKSKTPKQQQTNCKPHFEN